MNNILVTQGDQQQELQELRAQLAGLEKGELLSSSAKEDLYNNLEEAIASLSSDEVSAIIKELKFKRTKIDPKYTMGSSCEEMFTEQLFHPMALEDQQEHPLIPTISGDIKLDRYIVEAVLKRSESAE